ncbi:hypothetical protein [Streptomyces sp. NPDC057682]|uniref:hypothetical protein n=1 Tax=unclassified Streptomyces TaxID=2593676 RepID=UPI00364FBA7F
MKSLLWTVLVGAVAANVAFNFLVEQDALSTVLSAVSGSVFLVAGVGLWMTRGAHEE